MPTLDIQRLRESRKHKIICTHPGTGGRPFQLVGFRQEEFTIGGQAEYSNPFANAMQDRNVAIQAGVSELGALYGRLTGTDDALPVLNLATREQTRHQWVSSQRPQIPVNITLLKMQRADESVSKKAAQMVSMTMPSGTNAAATGVNFLKSPGGYNPANADGTWTVSIGEFFRADKLLLVSAQMMLSEAPTADGSPLYGVLQCMFEPHMIVTADEFMGWFVK